MLVWSFGGTRVPGSDSECNSEPHRHEGAVAEYEYGGGRDDDALHVCLYRPDQDRQRTDLGAVVDDQSASAAEMTDAFSEGGVHTGAGCEIR